MILWIYPKQLGALFHCSPETRSTFQGQKLTQKHAKTSVLVNDMERTKRKKHTKFGNPTKPTTLFENDALSGFFDGCWPLKKKIWPHLKVDPQRLKENVLF